MSKPQFHLTTKQPTETYFGPGVLDVNEKTTELYIRPGDRIAQAMLVQVPRCEFEAVEQLTITERGAGGFGSTGGGMTTAQTHQPVAWMWKVADSDWQLESTCPPERPLAIVEPLYTGYMADAYIGAREEVEIWKRRALEAEKKLQAEIARLTAENEALKAAVSEAVAEERMVCAELMEQQHTWITNVAASALIRARGTP